MARQTRLVLWTAALGIFLFILLRLFGQQPHQATLSSSLVFQNKEDVSSTDEKTQEIHIAAIVCGNRTTLGLTMMKSALIMCSDFIRFTLFVDNETSGVLNETIQLWPDNILKRMSLDMRPVSYPEDNTDEWNTLFKPCASVKLFLPVSSGRDMLLADAYNASTQLFYFSNDYFVLQKSLLKEVDSVLYVDVDTVFLSPPLHIWQHLGKMNHTQLVALGPEMQDHTKGWYNKYASHPYYGKFGTI